MRWVVRVASSSLVRYQIDYEVHVVPTVILPLYLCTQCIQVLIHGEYLNVAPAINTKLYTNL